MKNNLNINTLNQSFENSNIDIFTHNYSKTVFNLSSIRKRFLMGILKIKKITKNSI